MESIGSVWRQQKASILLEEYGWNCPIGEDVDILFTSKRLVFIATKLEPDSTGKWILGGAFAGPAGILLAGTAGAVWNTYKAARHNRKVEADMLDNLVENKVAISASTRGLICEIEQYRRTWFAPIKKLSTVRFIGQFTFGDKTMRGAAVQMIEKSGDKLARKIERHLPIKVVVKKDTDWDEDEAEDPQAAIEERVIGRKL